MKQEKKQIAGNITINTTIENDNKNVKQLEKRENILPEGVIINRRIY